MYEFELGPIRPPSEANSILLRLTRNCPWNKCAFCSVYKGNKFSLRTVDEVKGDIDSMYRIVSCIYEEIKKNGTDDYISEEVIDSLVKDKGIPQYNLQQIVFWMHYGLKSLFLQDADSMVYRPDDLVEVLNYVKEKFPTIERITCYSRSKTLVAKKIEDLRAIREAGLNRIHIGMETGSDTVLKMINKGVKSDEHIIAGRKVVDAGFELSEYYMPGIGGSEFTDENALETSRILNEINPSFIRIRTTTPLPGTELFDMMEQGQWSPLGEVGKAMEIRKMIENLSGITSYVQSDHMMNLIEDANGRLPEDRDEILSIFDRFFEMNSDDQESFIVARRTGRVRFFSEYKPDQYYDKLRDNLKSRYGSIDKAVLELSKNFL